MTNIRHNTFSKKALSVVLTLVMALSYAGLISGVVGNGIFSVKLTADAATTALTALPSTGNLSGRYKVTSSTSRGAGSLTVTGTTVIYVASGATLTVTGGNGSGTTGGSAGITVADGKTLIITGPGKLVVQGGKGGDGTNGTNGSDGSFAGQGDGGNGGNGGGGGGAGIGGDGGGGGSGTAGSTDGGGSQGGGGSDGSACGTVYILDSFASTDVTLTSGASGSKGGGGSAGSKAKQGVWSNSGGGGGGGGGAGAGGAAIGGGGGGAGGGGGGGEGVTVWGNSAEAGGGGKGGLGAVKGDDGGGSSGTSGGASGPKGSNGNNGTLYDRNKNATTAPNFAKGTVTFHQESGSDGSESVTSTIGYPMTSATMPSRDGYTFQGYYTGTGGTGTKYYNADGTSAHVYDYYELDLYAYWTPNDYTATFQYDELPDPSGNLNSGSTVDEVTYNPDSTLTFPAIADKDYYTTDHKWKATTTTGTTCWSVGDEVAAGTVTSTGKYGDVTFRAQYTPIDYQIEFDPNGGGDVESNWSTPYSNRYKYNYENRAKSDYTLERTLPAVVWVGRTLTGWKPTAAVGNWDPAHTYPAGTSLAGMHGDTSLDTVVLQAQWEPVTVGVTLNLAADESIVGSKTLSYAFTSSLTLNNPTKAGYTFKGWKVTQIPDYGDDTTTYPTDNRWEQHHEYTAQVVGGVVQPVTLPSGKLGDVTLTPMWEHIEYTVTFAGNGGTVSPTSKTYYVDDAPFTLPTPTRGGYTFNGWQVTEYDSLYNWTKEGFYAAGETVSHMYGTVTLTAQWTVADYTITLNVNGGDAISPSQLGYRTTASTTLPTPTRTGWTFTGWKVTGSVDGTGWTLGTVYTGSVPYGGYGDLTLTAQWVHTAYTISKSTSGTNGDDVTYYIDDAAFTLGASALAGYTFQYWQVTVPVGNWPENGIYYAGTSISGMYGDVEMSAVFQADTHYITYQDKNGDTIGDPQSFTIETTVTLPTYAADGYTFNGWNVVSASGGGWTNGATLAAGTYEAYTHYADVTLRAALTPVTYRITYDAAGGSPIAWLSYNIESAGDDFKLPTPTRNGYDFTGWKVTTAAGNWAADEIITAQTVADGAAVTGRWGSPTLTAQWTPKHYTITYYTGAYPGGKTKDGTFGQMAPDLTAQEKSKPADAQYTYTFDHWEPALATVTGEASYTAVYTSTVNKYDVTWMIPVDVGGAPGNYAGTVTHDWEFGTTPVYNNGTNPTMNSANVSEYSWRFIGWSETQGGAILGGLPAVTGAAVYYANFSMVETPVDIHWVIDGQDNNVEGWGVGETPVWQHDTPYKPDADGYRYEFTGWDPTPVPVVKSHGDYYYYAQFDPVLQDYTIDLSLNGGETESALHYDYQMGGEVLFPEPTKTGYRFDGWLLDAAVGTWTAGTTVPAGTYVASGKWGNVTLTAQWTAVEYTISFTASGDDNHLPDAMTYTIESTDAIPAAAREGYTQNGWVVSVGGGNWMQGATIATAYALQNNYGDITLTPVWQVRSFTITWDSDGAIETSEVEFGGAILAYTPASKMGYTADWDADVPATMPAHDLYFTAVYNAVDYYIRLNVNGGDALDNFYYTINGNNTLPTPTRSGATFTGWKVAAAQGNWVRNAVMEGGASLNGKYGNVSLTAQWELERHTVTWEAGDVTKTSVWLHGAVPSYDGTPYRSSDGSNSYTFRGWAASPDGEALENLPAVTADVTYYALFQATERKYAVAWDIDGAVRTEYYSYGATPVYPGESDPARASTTEYDFTFTGWSPAIGEVTADVTYYAQFDIFTKLQGLSIDASLLQMDIGEGAVAQARLYPATATVKDVTWTSLNTDVATVSELGQITAIGAGMALINVQSKDGHFNAYCVVTVAPTVARTVLITANSISTTQLIGASIQLSATVEPDHVTDPGLVWSTGDANVATVDQNGLVRFVGEGETDITAVTADGFAMGSIHVVAVTVLEGEDDTEEDVKTYIVTFGDFTPGYKFTADGESFTGGRLDVKEGDSLRFRLNMEDADEGKYTVYANAGVIRYGSDYWYEIDAVHENIVIRVTKGANNVGLPDNDDGDGMSFFQRIAAFFRKIVEFFRSIFKKA